MSMRVQQPLWEGAYAPGQAWAGTPFQAKEAMRQSRLQPWAHTALPPSKSSIPWSCKTSGSADKHLLQSPGFRNIFEYPLCARLHTKHWPYQKGQGRCGQIRDVSPIFSRPTTLTSTHALIADCLGYNLGSPLSAVRSWASYFTSLSLHCLICKMEAS